MGSRGEPWGPASPARRARATRWGGAEGSGDDQRELSAANVTVQSAQIQIYCKPTRGRGGCALSGPRRRAQWLVRCCRRVCREKTGRSGNSRPGRRRRRGCPRGTGTPAAPSHRCAAVPAGGVGRRTRNRAEGGQRTAVAGGSWDAEAQQHTPPRRSGRAPRGVRRQTRVEKGCRTHTRETREPAEGSRKVRDRPLRRPWPGLVPLRWRAHGHGVQAPAAASQPRTASQGRREATSERKLPVWRTHPPTLRRTTSQTGSSTPGPAGRARKGGSWRWALGPQRGRELGPRAELWARSHGAGRTVPGSCEAARGG